MCLSMDRLDSRHREVGVRLHAVARIDTFRTHKVGADAATGRVAQVVSPYRQRGWTAESPLPDLSLVDRLFLLTHDLERGTPIIGLDILGIGLVGASLLELTYTHCVGIWQNGVVRRTAEYGHIDDAAQYLLGCIMEYEQNNRGGGPTVAELIGAQRDLLYNGVAQSLAARHMFGATFDSRRGPKGNRFIPAHGHPRIAAEETRAWCNALFTWPQRAADAGTVALHLACLIGGLGGAPLVTAADNQTAQSNLAPLLGVCEVQHVQVIKTVSNAAGTRAMVPRR